MKAYMQRMGRSLMLPVATLPVAALFMELVTGSTQVDGAEIVFLQPS